MNTYEYLRVLHDGHSYRVSARRGDNHVIWLFQAAAMGTEEVDK